MQFKHHNPADLVVDTDGRDIVEVAAQLLELVEWRGPGADPKAQKAPIV